MEWMLRLVVPGIDGQSRSVDVMTVSRPDGLGDIANLGMTLAEAKLLLAQVQQQLVAEQANTQCYVSAGLPVVWWDISREGLGAAPDCHIVRRGETEASAIPVCRLRSW